MKMKKIGLLIALLASVLALLMLIPAAILPTLADGYQFANFNFNSYNEGQTLSQSNGFAVVMPSKATSWHLPTILL